MGAFRVFGFFFLCVFSLLLIVSIFREVAGQNPITFAYLLEQMQNCPNVVIQPFTEGGIAGDWGLFDFLRSFLNTIAYILSYFVYFVTLIIQVLVFAGYCLTVLFGVAPNVVVT